MMANPDSKREIELLHIIGTLTDSYRTIREWCNPEVDDLLGQIKEAMADATRMLQSVMKGPVPDMMKYEEKLP